MSIQQEQSELHNTLWKITHELCGLANGLISREVLEVWDMSTDENGKMMDESFRTIGAMTKNPDGAVLDKLSPPLRLCGHRVSYTQVMFNKHNYYGFH